MRTRRFLTTSAALLLMLAVIGAGFSYWFFGSNVEDEAQTVNNPEIVEQVTLGNITTADAFKIKFNQTALGREKYGSNAKFGTADVTDGITLVFDAAATNKTAVFNNTQVDDDQFTFTVTMSVKNALAEYFTVDYSTPDTDWSFEKKISGATDTEFVFTSTKNKTFDWDKVKFVYETDDTTVANGTGTKEPKNADEYTALSNLVNAGGITVTYKAEIKNS